MTFLSSFRHKPVPLLLLLAVAGVLTAQFRGPAGGVVYHEPSRSIRPIIGIPGSAYLGGPVLAEIDFASVSPDGRWALVSRGESQVAISGLQRMEPVEQSVDGLLPGIDLAAWNAVGNAAAVYSSSNKQIQTLRISEMLVAESSIDVSALGGKVTALAIDRDGRSIALLVEDTANPGLYLIADGAKPVLLAAIARADGVAFAPDRDLIAVMDRDAREIRLFTDRVLSGAIPMGVDGDEWSYRSRLAVSDDGSEIYAVAGLEPALFSYDLRSHELVSRQPLDSPPDSLAALPVIHSYVLNSAAKAGEPMVVYQRGVRNGLYFIPAGEISPATP